MCVLLDGRDHSCIGKASRGTCRHKQTLHCLALLCSSVQGMQLCQRDQAPPSNTHVCFWLWCWLPPTIAARCHHCAVVPAAHNRSHVPAHRHHCTVVSAAHIRISRLKSKLFWRQCTVCRWSECTQSTTRARRNEKTHLEEHTTTGQHQLEHPPMSLHLCHLYRLPPFSVHNTQNLLFNTNVCWQDQLLYNACHVKYVGGLSRPTASTWLHRAAADPAIANTHTHTSVVYKWLLLFVSSDGAGAL